MGSRRHSLILCLLALTTEPSLATNTNRYLDEIFPRISIVSNIVYSEAPEVSRERARLCLDLYAPADDTEKSRPVILLIHGGGFYKGDKKDPQMVALATRFARCGYVVLSMNYRLAHSKADVDAEPANALRIATDDARAALDWASTNRSAYGMDMMRLTVGGGSAGAFTSLAIAYGPKRTEMHSVRIRAVIDFWGGLPWAESMKQGDPPLIIIHGTDDKIVPYSFAERLDRRAKEVGIPCEFHPLAGSGHAAWEGLDKYVAWIAPFLKRHVIDGGTREGAQQSSSGDGLKPAPEK